MEKPKKRLYEIYYAYYSGGEGYNELYLNYSCFRLKNLGENFNLSDINKQDAEFKDSIKKNLDSMSFSDLESHFKNLELLVKGTRAYHGRHKEYILAKDGENKEEFLLSLYRQLYEENCNMFRHDTYSPMYRIPNPETLEIAQDIDIFQIKEVREDDTIIIIMKM